MINNVQLFTNKTSKYDHTTIVSRRTNQISTILDGLLKDYQAHTRPNFGDGPTKVHLDILINSFGPIQDMDMSYTINCYFRQGWRDERLQFAEEVGVLSLSTKMLERLWRPDTIFYNSQYSYLHTIPTSNRLWRLFPNGSIWYSSRITVKAKCNMNLKNFPVDTQICHLLIGSFANSALDIQYNWRLGNNKSVNFDTKVLLSQFDLIQYPQYDEITNTNGRIQHAVFKVPKNKQVIVLDFADERMPGGYFLENAMTQEEVILYNSDGYQALLDLKYKLMDGGYMLPEYGVAYIKRVRFFQKQSNNERFTDLIVAACYDLSGIGEGLYIPPLSNDMQQIRSRTLQKFQAIIASAVANTEGDGGDTYLLLGPIGTGAFKNDKKMIAELFFKVLNNPLMNSYQSIRYAFDQIWFVSTDNHQIFEEVFKNH
ncbi:unnamed protein product [Adineta steineri]|uniref:Neurotransmitter-gated ion-channel ligand-binding domain-containing protein n=1 Tax=Adineta steineri TaxID=433720 RepID=A0A814XNJ6_9BILA|nr:unnamed protein product [Adineta steineri]